MGNHLKFRVNLTAHHAVASWLLELYIVGLTLVLGWTPVGCATERLAITRILSKLRHTLSSECCLSCCCWSPFQT